MTPRAARQFANWVQEETGCDFRRRTKSTMRWKRATAIALRMGGLSLLEVAEVMGLACHTTVIYMTRSPSPEELWLSRHMLDAFERVALADITRHLNGVGPRLVRDPAQDGQQTPKSGGQGPR